MEPEARACAKLSRAAPGFASARRRRAMRHLPAPETIDALLEYLVYGAGPETELGDVLEAGEGLLASKDVRAANLISSVLLEKLQLLVSYPDNSLTSDQIEATLGPLSLAAWRELEQLWRAVGEDLSSRPSGITVSDYLKLASAELRREFRGTYRVMPSGSLVGVFDILRWETGHRYAQTAGSATQSATQSTSDQQATGVAEQTEAARAV
jgi:hypothetical protein